MGGWAVGSADVEDHVGDRVDGHVEDHRAMSPYDRVDTHLLGGDLEEGPYTWGGQGEDHDNEGYWNAIKQLCNTVE